jgi:hypothetical protein
MGSSSLEEHTQGTRRRLVPTLANEQNRRCPARMAGELHEPCEQHNRKRNPGLQAGAECHATHLMANAGSSPLANGRAAQPSR